MTGVWLPLLLLIPLAAGVAIVFAPSRHAKWIALLGSLVTFVISVIAAFFFKSWMPDLDANEPLFGLISENMWLTEFDIGIDFGVDSVAMLLVLLSTMLMPLCVWGSFTAITDRVKEYYGWMMVLAAAMVGVFVATDLVFFYVCFEFTLVPMFFLIAIYGGEGRGRASTKFFIYTFTGSLLALAGLLYVAWRHADGIGRDWTFDIQTLTQFAASSLSAKEQALVLLALLAGFAVKVPLFPVHTWLPLAHTEAPTAGSVILAAVLLKLGTYGLFRFVLPMVPVGLVEPVSLLGIEFVPVRLIAVVSIVGIVYAALICWVQTDVKRLVAYSSVSHLGFCVLGLFALNPLGAQGSVLYMINHGLSTGALFFLIGMIYERYHTRDMEQLSGLARKMPVWAFFMVFFIMSSVGLPGLNGFISEFLCLIAAFGATSDAIPYPGMLGPWYAAVAGTGMILAAMYLLILAGKVVFGPLREPAAGHDEHTLPADLNAREICVLAPLAVLCVVLGLYPKPLTSAMEPSIEHTLEAARNAVVEHYAGESNPQVAVND